MGNQVTDKSGTYDVTKLELRLQEIDTGLRRSRLRQKMYEDKGDARSAEIEESVQDRLLRDRILVTR